MWYNSFFFIVLQVNMKNTVVKNLLMSYKQLIFIILLYSSTCNVFAQWNDFITNYKKEDFGRGAQTWQIGTYSSKYIFCGNKNGLLQYDGYEWTLFPLSRNLDARSVCVSETSNRVYVGGENEFGYFTPNPAGQLFYTKTSAHYTDPQNLNRVYWGVYEVDNIMYFVSDRIVVKKIEDNFTTILSDFKIDCSAVINGVLFTGSSSGIWMLVGSTWLPAFGGDILENKMIRKIIPYKEGYLVATAFDGLFYGDKNGVSRFVTGSEDFMRKYEIFSLAANDNYIAVGTILNGLLVISSDGKKRYYNVQNGLQNNTVLSICFDKKFGLWVGLDNGIDFISLDMPLTNLYISPYSRGTGYAALIDGNKLYLGTNRGLYNTDLPIEFGENDINIKLIPELSGQVWGLEKIGDEIFCLHDKGVFYIKNNKVTQINGLRGGLSAYLHEDNANKCWIGVYDGLLLIEKKNGKWDVTRKIEGELGWMRNVRFESPYVLWMHNEDKGVIRYEFNKQMNKVIDTRVYGVDKGFESIENIRVHKIFGYVYFSSSSGIYKYDSVADEVVKDEKLMGLLPENHIYINYVSSENTLYGITSNMVMSASLTGDTRHNKNITFNSSQIDFIRLYENIKAINDTIAIIPNEYGFALLNTGIQDGYKQNELFIKNVFLSYPKDSILYTDNYLDKTQTPQIAYFKNSIRFDYAIRSFSNGNNATYRFRLLPDKEWSEYTTLTTKEYGNLREGNYIFEVEAISQNVTLPSITFSFTILPPWYRSIYAIFTYIMLIAGFMYSLYIWDKRRIIRNRKADLEQKDEEMKAKEQEFQEEQLRSEQKITTLQKENLEQELRFKSQEMANLMINFTRKNEILMDIKKGLSRINTAMKDDSSVKAKRMIITLNNSIDSNIASDDALKRFEEQFNIVHNNFIEKIREKHSDLTSSELKMCTYIKMELSSKEIAPLLNISIRGIETLRYRLRKKIGLERDASLTKYINSF